MFLIDSANALKIHKISHYYPIYGVTTNPTILSKEASDTGDILKELKTLLKNKPLYIQVASLDYDGMIHDITTLKPLLSKEDFIKVPATKEGYRFMRKKHKEYNIAATAVASLNQAMMSIAAGASEVIVYVDRMIKNNLNPFALIMDIKDMIYDKNLDVKIIGASFKRKDQIEDAMIAGCDYVTIPPELFEQAFTEDLTELSVETFYKDAKK
ncbi:MAG: transaldolase family protein [Candidatus Izemoplasmataceae bacterium]